MRTVDKRSIVSKCSWTPEEDAVLTKMVTMHGPKRWSLIAQSLEGRVGKQCRERWHNHLSPDVRKDAWTPEEDALIFHFVEKLGTKWAAISKHLSGRTDNSIKNRYYCSLKKLHDLKRANAATPSDSGTEPSSPSPSPPPQQQTPKKTKQTPSSSELIGKVEPKRKRVTSLSVGSAAHKEHSSPVVSSSLTPSSIGEGLPAAKLHSSVPAEPTTKLEEDANVSECPPLELPPAVKRSFQKDEPVAEVSTPKKRQVILNRTRGRARGRSSANTSSKLQFVADSPASELSSSQESRPLTPESTVVSDTQAKTTLFDGEDVDFEDLCHPSFDDVLLDHLAPVVAPSPFLNPRPPLACLGDPFDPLPPSASVHLESMQDHFGFPPMSLLCEYQSLLHSLK